MAHRGRLNVLANIIGIPLAKILSEFEEIADPLTTQGSGDVKYHLGAVGKFRSPEGAEISVSVAPNPSHLEWVNPVIEGIVRAKQERRGDAMREQVLPILIHGDAAFAGQGVVWETINLSQLYGYRTGGTIHIIINNQIGFTTPPWKRVPPPILPILRGPCRRRFFMSMAMILIPRSGWHFWPSLIVTALKKMS